MCLKKIEEWFSGIWEKTFRKPGRPLQPIEIARFLTREMEVQKRISVNKIYVPNTFTIKIGKEEYAKMSPLRQPFSIELEEHLIAKAREKSYTLIGRPKVDFCEDPNLGLGEMGVISNFAGSPLRSAPEAPLSLDDEKTAHTMIFTQNEAALSAESSGEVSLIVTAGPDKGSRFPLEKGKKTIVGRSFTAQATLSDPTVSREHALLEWRGEELHIVDMGSKNGIWVNGAPVEEIRLRSGDLIQIGDSLLEIEGI